MQLRKQISQQEAPELKEKTLKPRLQAEATGRLCGKGKIWRSCEVKNPFGSTKWK